MPARNETNERYLLAPPAKAARRKGARRLDEDDSDNEADAQLDELSLDVELRVFEMKQAPLRAPTTSWPAAARYQKRRRRRRQDECADDSYGDVDYTQVAAAAQVAPACDLTQRLVSADKRRQLCFRFEFQPQLSQLIATNKTPPPESPRNWPEHLVEAELHVYKLVPLVRAAAETASGQYNSTRQPITQVSRNSVELKCVQIGNRQQINRNTSTQLNSTRFATKNQLANSRMRNLYHLKTNLLEVSSSYLCVFVRPPVRLFRRLADFVCARHFKHNSSARNLSGKEANSV